METEFRIVFRPDRKGMKKFFGDLEAEVMEIVWKNDPVTVKRVQYFLDKKRKYAYTTIMTVLRRLYQKGYLQREKKGHSFRYLPVLNREEFLQYALGRVVRGIASDFKPIGINLLQSLEEVKKMSQESRKKGPPRKGKKS